MGDYFHWLHHRYFEGNYGELTVPLDKWFGTYRDGPEAYQSAATRPTERHYALAGEDPQPNGRNVGLARESGNCHFIGGRTATLVTRSCEHRDGRWIAAQVKLGGPEAIVRGARALLRLRAGLDRARTADPTKLLVITAGGYAYERPDGICVAPITSLGP